MEGTCCTSNNGTRYVYSTCFHAITTRMMYGHHGGEPPRLGSVYPVAAHAQSRVKCSLSVSRSMKCPLNAQFMALAASKKHMDKEKSTYFYVHMLQEHPYGSILSSADSLAR